MTSLFVAAILTGLAGCGEEASPLETTDKVEAQGEAARTVKDLGPVKFTVEMAPGTMRLSDEPVLTLTIEAAEGVVVERPAFGGRLGAFAIRDFREPLPEVKDGKTVIRQICILEPMETGEHYIYPIPVRFTDGRPGGDGEEHVIESEGLTVMVESVLSEEAPSLIDLAPPAGPVTLPDEAAPIWPWIAGGATILPIVALFLIHRRLRRRAVFLEKRYSPQELAFLELESLLEQDLIHGDVKLFYVALTGIVRRYIERTTGVRAPEQTTEEFLHAIGEGDTFSAEERERLQDFLESADLVKFAAFEPGKEEIEESFRRAKRFIGLETTVEDAA